MDDFAVSFKEINNKIRKESRSVKNRIHSILADSKFIQEVFDAYNFPVLCNERAGRWYVPPSIRSGSVYFKSTDGHTRQWAFSTIRLNLNLLEIIQEHKGAVIVDSTRRGKRYPDALCKTIPIWCAVINQTLFGKSHTLFTPFTAVSRSEHSQIEELLEVFCEKFANCGVDLTSLRSKISLPIRPLFIDPTSFLPATENFSNPYGTEYYPLILCSASQAVQDGTDYRQGYSYVQGAADDHELWASKLNPEMLWNNLDTLGNPVLSNEELYARIGEYSTVLPVAKHNGFTRIHPSLLSISKGPPVNSDTFVIDLRHNVEEKDLENMYAAPLAPGKKGAKELRIILPKIAKIYEKRQLFDNEVLICCDTGSDFSVGVAVTLLCLFYGPTFEPLNRRQSSFLNKAEIRRRLVHIISVRGVNPSRATLNAVNSFLMS